MIRRNKHIFFLVLVILLSQPIEACFWHKKTNTKALLKQHKAEVREKLELLLRAARTKFEKNSDKKGLIFVDIDRTLVDDDGKPIVLVIQFCIDMKKLGYTLIVLSSRQDYLWNETDAELRSHDFTEYKELILLPTRYHHKTTIGAWKEAQRIDAAKRLMLPVTGVIDDRPENLHGDSNYLGHAILMPES